MTTIAILPGNHSWFLRGRREGMCAEMILQLPFEAFSSRPDPIQRAWDAVEAKRGMRNG